MLASDGGAQSGRGAAAAALVDIPGGERHCVAVYLGKATNNEAEIFGALIGFSMLRQLAPEGTRSRVTWLCDSEYVLKSATGYIWNWQRNGWRTAGKDPVKNQGLWRAYLKISEGFEITPEHVRGHTGHPENELCDLACNELIIKAEELFEHASEDRLDIDDTVWAVFDCRAELAALRNDQPQDVDIDGLRGRLGASQGEDVKRKLLGGALCAKLSEIEALAVQLELEKSIRDDIKRLLARVTSALELK